MDFGNSPGVDNLPERYMFKNTLKFDIERFTNEKCVNYGKHGEVVVKTASALSKS